TFYNKGIMLRSSNIEYYISELPQIKHNIIAEATKDAKIRAMKVADSSGGKVGKIISARVGVFQITEPLSTEVASYGIYSTSSKQKQISVTVSTEYELK
ncbi:MAG TPA: SIMPL domain-containing protein, partial [Candidatus Cloacimonadota bacterium]|nr:SIMPL domain-containing protein [Candidatus Cloacimonadota bacterium]